MTPTYRVPLATLTLLSIALPLLAGNPSPGDTISVSRIFSDEVQAVTSTGSFQWLANNTLLYYDRQLPPADRRLDMIDPATGAMTTLVRGSDALASMRTVLGEATAPTSFPFPAEIDNGGRCGLYEFNGDLYCLEFRTAGFRRLTTTPQEEKCAAFSPDGKLVSFVRSNNLFIIDLESGAERQVTTDGSDSLLNGTLSWVYWEEVYGRRDNGYWWSDDSKSLAFFRTDEAGVSLQHYVDFKPWNPEIHYQRYPKVGEKNPVVRVGVFSLEHATTRWMELEGHTYEYVVRVQWLPDNRRLAVRTMNRSQSEMDLFFVDGATGSPRHILREVDSGWVNVSDDLVFLRDGRHFLWSSERDGFKHLYRYSMDGTLVNRVTRGNWSLRASGGPAWVDQAVQGVDEQGGWIYCTALEKSPIEHHLYRVKPDGSGFSRITREEGTHAVNFSPNGKFFVDRWSNARTLPSLTLCRGDGSPVRVLASPHPERIAKYGLQYPEFFTIPARDGFHLPAQILKPAGFDPGRKYPVIFYVYGGPSAPQVSNEWQRYLFWENVLARQGYIVLHVDPRSATAISKRLENLVARRLMTDVELNDLVDAAHWVKAQPFVDSTRLGIWGWSGGGTYTMLAMTKSREFRAGIAVAGVTDFRFYDTKFGESVMKTEQDNRKGLDDFSLLQSARNLNGRLMIVHGTYDDNVHIQNAWAFIDELINANKQFDLMVYPMRQHGIADRPARIHLFTTMLEFWKRNL